ncbi:uncharacterized protein LOC114393834 [Glycine soja]|uniref:DUF7138 domain-containing protein n=1 Tax=Glycine soja TaxID=3848 RepID=A0A445LR49_GLYSO|nr:uncharacterized protein LOC114393834 [Glycine soja]RZC25799.1 hypothetical protein D0Y65_004485 [Glycine soja]
MIDGGSTSVAVVYSDGSREINVGTVAVDPTLNFKSLLTLLSQRIGISPHQFSVYLAAVGTDRKIPVTAKLNLATVRRDGATHYFFVKRSKRNKKANGNGKDAAKKNHHHPRPENVILLRRAAASAVRDPPLVPPILNPAQYERRLMTLQIERQSYLMNMKVGVNGGAAEREFSNTSTAAVTAACDGCSKAKITGINGGFHLCVHDAVTVGFRSPAGPITRPAKTAGEAGP